MSENMLRDINAPQPSEKNIDPNERMFEIIQDLTRRVSELETQGKDNVEIKSDTGDFAAASSWNGRRVVNTADTTYKVFIGGSWRTLFPYP
jgi:hypothetical protein